MHGEEEQRIWFRHLPDDWALQRIKSVCAKNDGGVWGEDCLDDRGVTVLRSNEITRDGHWNIQNPAVRSLSEREALTRRLQSGDLLLVKSSGSVDHIGKTALVNSEIDSAECCFSNFTQRIRFRDHLAVSKFMWYLFNNSPGRDQLFYFGTTTTGLINLSGKNVGRMLAPIPPRNEQLRIVAYLDASCSTIGLVITKKKAQLDTLDALRKSIITAAVLGGVDDSVKLRQIDNPWLTHLPEHWTPVALKRVSGMQTGLTLGKTYEPPLVERPYLRAANVQDGYVDLEKVTRIEVPIAVAVRHALQPGDVLMTEGGDLDKLGRGTVWNGEIHSCMHQNHVFALRCHRHKLLPKFLAYVTASSYGRDYFEATGKRTTNLASTNSTKVGMIPMPLPPLPEQQTIIEYLDGKLADLAQTEECIRRQVGTLEGYRKSLIHECVTGARRITDAEINEVQGHG